MEHLIMADLIFPKWKISYKLNDKLDKSGKVSYLAVRNSSSAFIKRKDVRLFIFSRNNYKCIICGSDDYLQVDHKVSVYRWREVGIELLNDESNLQTLCRKCNASKLP